MKRSAWAVAAAFVLCSLNAEAAWEIQERREQSLVNGALRFVQEQAVNGSRVSIDAVLFAESKFTFRVIDNPDRASRLDEVMAGNDALAGVNGGYFHPDSTPLGLVVSAGKRLHSFQTAKLLSGLVVAGPKGIALLRSREFTARLKPENALQAGPFLLDRGQPVAGLNNTRRAVRTVVISDGKGRFGLLLCRSATLAECARLLAQPQLLPGFAIARALNLDGGSSSALWVRTEPPFSASEWKSVRNFLAIVPRGKTARP